MTFLLDPRTYARIGQRAGARKPPVKTVPLGLYQVAGGDCESRKRPPSPQGEGIREGSPAAVGWQPVEKPDLGRG
jgi:hypothetical protein